jgi:flagellar biosynthetic protein FlhB
MANQDDKESKTEEATEKKIRDALEKGNVPFSRELGTFSGLVGLLIVMSFFAVGSVLELTARLQRFIDDPGRWSLENSADAVQVFGSINFAVVQLLAPAILAIAVAGIGSSMLQNSPRIVFDRVQPKLSRLSLKSGWRRIFGVQGWVEFLKGAFKLGALALLAFLLARAARFEVFNAMFMSPFVLPQLMQTMVIRLFLAVIAAIVLLVVADLVWSRFFWRKELRMTRQEIKDEQKQSEGDPIVKARLRSLARDRARKRMMARVPKATLVIANPTHYAVALRYVRSENRAPLVVAKGLDLIALKIRSVAEKHGIPVVEDKLLARSLYDNVKVDQLIPPEFYKAVANLILFLMSRGKHSQASGPIS